MLWQSGDWERQVIREQLADEVEPVITPEEYAAVKRDHPFATRYIPGLDRRTSAAIVRAKMNSLCVNGTSSTMVRVWKQTHWLHLGAKNSRF